ncbi:MAG: glycosyltransferase [Planctomycetota bacterium]
MSRPSILFVCAGVPAPPFTGAAQRNHLFYESLRKIGDVTTVAIAEPRKVVSDEAKASLRESHNVADFLEALEMGETGLFKLIHGFNPRRVEYLARGIGDADREYVPQKHLFEVVSDIVHRENIDLIVGRYANVLGKTGALDLAPTLLDVDDLQTEMIERSIAGARGKGIPLLLQKRRLARLRSKLPVHFRRYAGRWIANESHRSFEGLEDATVLPNIPYASYERPDLDPTPADPENRTLLFVGSLSHNPNVFGLERFLAASWPAVRERVPDAKLLIVGSGNIEAVKRKTGEPEGVEFRGLVEDIADAYSETAATVVPIHSGSGTNIKVAETYYFGRAAVVSAFALRGYDHALKDGTSVLSGHDDAQLAESCVRLLREPELRDSLACQGRKAILEQYSFDVFSKRVGELATKALAG